MNKREKIFWKLIVLIILVLAIIANTTTIKTFIISVCTSVVVLIFAAAWVDVMKVLDRERDI